MTISLLDHRPGSGRGSTLAGIAAHWFAAWAIPSQERATKHDSLVYRTGILRDSSSTPSSVQHLPIDPCAVS